MISTNGREKDTMSLTEGLDTITEGGMATEKKTVEDSGRTSLPKSDTEREIMEDPVGMIEGETSTIFLTQAEIIFQ